MKKKRKGISRNVLYCPYCGARTELRTADGIYHDNRKGTMLYVCKNYPSCDTYVRVIDGTTKPVGSLANGRLRALRKQAHQSFDQLHLCGIMSRAEAYQWLSATTGLPMNKTHIGDMGEYFCEFVIQECNKLLNSQKRKRRPNSLVSKRGVQCDGIDSGTAACG